MFVNNNNNNNNDNFVVSKLITKERPVVIFCFLFFSFCSVAYGYDEKEFIKISADLVAIAARLIDLANNQ